jgi:hypothetical protein
MKTLHTLLVGAVFGLSALAAPAQTVLRLSHAGSPNEASIVAELRAKGVQVLESVDPKPFRMLASKQSATYFSRRFAPAEQPPKP